MAVYAYVRVATQNQVATDQQLQRIREFATRKGMEIPEENAYSDVISGNSPVLDRPGFRALWQRIGPEDLVLVHRLDRLSRAMLPLMDCLTAINERGILVESVDEDDIAQDD